MKRVELDGDAVVLRVRDPETGYYKDVIFVRSPGPVLNNVWEQLSSYQELLDRAKVC